MPADGSMHASLCRLLRCGLAPGLLAVATASGVEVKAQVPRLPGSDITLTVTQIPLPDFPGANVIWGATGRDSRGHIWIGVSAEGGDGSARLFEHDPEAGSVTDRGSVVAMLKKLGLLRPGETQVKIHSKIWQVGDHLYFSSTDEAGEQADGSAPPRWGSHLWRLRLTDHSWEHLLAVPEGLTAVAAGGSWVYALGLWNHVLYQYDTRNGQLRRTAVGSVAGHMSRNLVADNRGHVYVPRIRNDKPKATHDDPFGLTGLRTSLVEFDKNLAEVGETPLRGYADPRDPTRSHGLTGFAHLADGSIAIALHTGALYRILPKEGGLATIEDLGWFHPLGTAYTPSLFVVDERGTVAGVAQPPRGGYVWLVRDLSQKSSRPIVSFPFTSRELLLYGSATRDDKGHFYVAGRHMDPAGRGPRPLLLRIEQR